MATVQDYERCSRCGGLTLSEWRVSSGESWRICQRCGLDESTTLIWGEDGKPVLDDDGYFKYETIVEGRGAYCLTSRDDAKRRVGVLPDDFDPGLLSEAFDIAALERDCDPAASYIAYFDCNTGVVSVLWGDLEPPMFDDALDDEDRL
jgi:hypothetical protein